MGNGHCFHQIRDRWWNFSIPVSESSILSAQYRIYCGCTCGTWIAGNRPQVQAKSGRLLANKCMCVRNNILVSGAEQSMCLPRKLPAHATACKAHPTMYRRYRWSCVDQDVHWESIRPSADRTSAMTIPSACPSGKHADVATAAPYGSHSPGSCGAACRRPE